MGEGRLLERYRAEIIQLCRQRKTQAQIHRLLEYKYDIDIAKTTLTDFIKALRESGALRAEPEPHVTPEEEHFLEQYEVYDSLQRSSKEMLDATARMITRIKNLDDAMREQTEGILEALQGVLEAVERRPAPQPVKPPLSHALLVTLIWTGLLAAGAAAYFVWR
jgi:hypothetical protein